MRALIQRVARAEVKVDGQSVGSVGKGMLILLGVHKEDRPEQTAWMVQKLLNLRIFADAQDKMNLSLKEIEGEALIVSQFTLYGNCLEGRRPDFFAAAPPEQARAIYEKFVAEMKQALGRIQTGVFGARMEVSLVNDGPVTFVIDSATISDGF